MWLKWSQKLFLFFFCRIRMLVRFLSTCSQHTTYWKPHSVIRGHFFKNMSQIRSRFKRFFPFPMLHLSTQVYGIWIGSSRHVFVAVLTLNSLVRPWWDPCLLNRSKFLKTQYLESSLLIFRNSYSPNTTHHSSHFYLHFLLTCCLYCPHIAKQCRKC